MSRMFYLVSHSERSPLDEAMKAFLCACLNETNRYLGGYYIALIFSHGSTEFHGVFFCASVQGTFGVAKIISFEVRFPTS